MTSKESKSLFTDAALRELRSTLGQGGDALANLLASLASRAEQDLGVSSEESVTLTQKLAEVAFRSNVISNGVQAAAETDSVFSEVSFLFEKGQVDEALLPLMAEDYLTSLPIQNADSGWQLVEKHLQQLIKACLLIENQRMKLSGMVILRLCNNLLERLSSSFDTGLSGRVLMFLSTCFPLAHKSAVNLVGSYNETNVTEYEAEEDVKSDVVVNYTLYKRFWDLQRYFMSKSLRDGGCLQNSKSWNEFVEVSNSVLTAFESNPFLEAQTGHPQDKSFFSTKYLSSGRLLSLQLRDPTMRRNILCQFLILFNELDIKKQENEIPAILVNKLINDKKNGLNALRERVLSLLRDTPPNGKKFVDDIDGILKREVSWVRWKRAGCPDFERPSVKERKFSDQELARRNAKETIRSRLEEKKKTNCSLWRSKLATWKEDLSDPEVNAVPTLETFLEPMREAMDPENCIEDEYHPKHDDIYCWRGLRLLARNKLEVAITVQDGDLEKAVAKLPGLKDVA